MKSAFIQYQIKEGEDAILSLIIRSVAERFSLVDIIVTSREPNTLANFSETLGAGFAVGARRRDNLLIVDFNPRANSREKFQQVMDEIVRQFFDHFGTRVSLATPEEYIPAQSSLPLSPEQRQQIQALYGANVANRIDVELP